MTNTSTKPFAFFIICFAGLGGMLYGFDIGILSGAIGFIRDQIHLTVTQTSFIVASVLGGGAIATLISGPLSDWIGRRTMIIIAAITFCIGIITLVFSNQYETVLAGRLIQGIGVGIITIIIPLYLTESAPASLRGRSMTIFQIFLTGGILLATIVDLALVKTGNWHLMFATALVPGSLLFIACFWLTESPRWLFLKNHPQKALEVLKLTRSDFEAENDLREMQQIDQEQQKSNGQKESIFKKQYLLPFALALTIACLNQLTGINTLLQYSTVIIKDFGLSSNVLSMVGTVGVTTVNFATTLFAFFLIDHLGRRPLMIIGTLGTSLSLALFGFVGMLPVQTVSGELAVASMMAYIFFFAIGPGIIVWLAISELLPTKIRGTGMALCLFANSLTSTVLAGAFLDLSHMISVSGVFWMCSGFTFIYFLLICRFMPETKNKSLEEIEHEFREAAHAKTFTMEDNK